MHHLHPIRPLAVAAVLALCTGTLRAQSASVPRGGPAILDSLGAAGATADTAGSAARRDAGADSARGAGTGLDEFEAMGEIVGSAGVATPSPGAELASPLTGLAPTAADSAASAAALGAAALDPALHILVSIDQRRMWVVRGGDTLLTAPVSVGMDARLAYAGRDWTFKTPRGVRTVLHKRRSPSWTPPDWHYAEVAAENGLHVARLKKGRPVKLADGRRLEVRGELVGVLDPVNGFEPLPTDEEIIFGDTLWVPPYGTKNREIEGELGAYQLDLGNGYLLHGTPHEESIGNAATHGCIRLPDDAVAWAYQHVPIGTHVYIF